MRMLSSSRLCRAIACCLTALTLLFPVLAQAPVITITPDAGEVESALLAIRIDGLAANSAYRVEFEFDGAVIVGSDEVSDSDGSISFPAGSTEGDLPGIYSVRVLRDGVALASADFELTPKAGGGEVTVRPQRGPIGTLHEIQVAGLARNTTYAIQISARQTNEMVYRRERQSDDRGRIKLEVFAESGDATGAQAIAILDGAGNQVAAGSFHIDAASAAEINFALESTRLNAGDSIAIQVDELPANASVTAQMKSAADVLINTAMARASVDGDVSLSIETPADLPPAEYRVELFVEGDLAGELSLTLDAADDSPQPADAAPQPLTPATTANATIQPQAAPIGSAHRISVTGLEANEAIEFDVAFNGASVYRTAKTADSSGHAELELLTDSGDQPGDYSVSILRQSGNQPGVILTALPIAADSVAVDSASDISGVLRSGAGQISFAATAGQYLLITARADAFAAAMRLKDPSGRVVGESQQTSLGPLRADSTGDYTLEVFPAPSMAQANLDGLPFSVTIAPVTVDALTFDTPMAFRLSLSAPAQYFAFAVDSGDRLNLSVDSGGSLDTVLQVVAPDGSVIAMDDDSGSGLDAEISNLPIADSGVYVAAVSTFDGIAVGGGSLTVKRNTARALELETVIVTLSDKMIRDLVVFDAAEDELLVLRLDKLAGDVEDLFVTATVDGMEVMSYMTMGVPDELPLPFVMPMAGQVLVTLEKVGVMDGIALAVSLQRP